MAREQRRRVAVGPHPEQHDVEDLARNLLAHRQPVEPRGVLGLLGQRHGVQQRRLGARMRVQRVADHLRVGLRVPVGDAALVAEPEVDVLPRPLDLGEQLVRALRRAPARQRDVDLAALLARFADPPGDLVGGVARDRLGVGKAPDLGHGPSSRRVASSGCCSSASRWSLRMTCIVALMSARCVKACGKLPRCRPDSGSSSSP